MNDEEMDEWQEILSNSTFEKPIKDVKKAYGSRPHSELPWKEYAEHDMESHTVDYDGK